MSKKEVRNLNTEEEKKSALKAKNATAKPVNNPEEQGQTGNIKQNTTNQGYQQDR